MKKTKINTIHLKRFEKTRIVLLTLCLTVIGVALFIQLSGQSQVEKCSYLDPITIDIFAFLAGLFLIIEGLYSINKNKNFGVKNQIHRIIRVAFGCAIVTLHIIQFLHKG